MDEARPMKRAIGFTLIELLVVIAIISLLVSILLPSLNRAKQLAVGVICASNLRHVDQSMMMYAIDHDDTFFPPYVQPASVFVLGPQWGKMTEVVSNVNWTGPLYDQYVTNGWMFTCPSMKSQDEVYALNHPGSEWYPHQWWANQVYGCAGDKPGGGWAANWFHGPDDIPDPGSTIHFADSIYCPPDGEVWESYVLARDRINGTNDPVRSSLNIRHTDKANVAFYDGHVEAVTGDWAKENGYDHWYYTAYSVMHD